MMLPGFPRDLLSRPAQDRLEYFKNVIILHPHLKKVFDEIIEIVQKREGVSSIFVLCCPGAGKTTVRKLVEDKLFEMALVDLNNNSGCIPFFSIEAVAPGLSRFNRQDFYIRSLNGLQEPLIEHKVAFDENKSKSNSSESKMLNALNRCIYHRQLQTFIVDEAHHLLQAMSGSSIFNQQDTLNSSMTELIWIWLDNYELRHFAKGDKSTRIIHLPRYRAEYAEDLQIFKDILWTFQCHLPVSKVPDLTNRWEFFYERCCGCVGILKDWLTRTLRAVLEDDRKNFSWKYINATAISTSRLYNMALEIIASEKAVEELMTKYNSVNRKYSEV